MKEAPNIPPSNSSAPPAGGPKRGGRVTDRIMPAELRQQQSGSFTQRVILPYLEKLVAPRSWLYDRSNPDILRVRLLRAGFPYGLTAGKFLAIKTLMVPPLLALLALFYFPILQLVAEAYGYSLSWGLCPFVMILGACYGYILPDTWLGMQIRKRQTEIQLALPDMMDLISVSVEAGLGLISAIQRISERYPNALSDEFERTLQEVRLGRAQTDALRDMARRCDVPDLTSLLTSIVQAEILGLAVSNVLRVQSERLRERRAQRAREAAQKAPIKMTFPLVLFIFPALFIVILGPAFLKIFLQQNAF